jgi:pyrimidine-nucleoside phosphorylase
VLLEVGFAMMGQTGAIAPADKKLYALRDATATVASIPLIVASIMSKKLAAGLDALVLDVKTGSGAFIAEEEKATELARSLVAAGSAFGLRTEALITDMNQPLGRAVGNALETRECLDILRGERGESVRPVIELSLELAARMLHLAGLESSLDAARSKVRSALETGAALERFRACVEAQGGDPRVCDRPARLLPLTLREIKVESPRSGFVTGIDAAEIGRALICLGGGRVRVGDAIDGAVGFVAEAKIGDQVIEREALGLLYYHDESLARAAAARIRGAYQFKDEPPATPITLIKEVITA